MTLIDIPMFWFSEGKFAHYARIFAHGVHEGFPNCEYILDPVTPMLVDNGPMGVWPTEESD